MSNERLQRVFEDAARSNWPTAKEQLAYRHMLALADMWEGWSMDPRTSPQRTAQLLGWADALRRVAYEVGPDWDPPRPECLTLIGWMGRKALGEV